MRSSLVSSSRRSWSTTAGATPLPPLHITGIDRNEYMQQYLQHSLAASGWPEQRFSWVAGDVAALPLEAHSVRTWRAVQNDVEGLILRLKDYTEAHDEEQFYAVRAIDEGRFKNEIVPIEIETPEGKQWHTVEDRKSVV